MPVYIHFAHIIIIIGKYFLVVSKWNIRNENVVVFKINISAFLELFPFLLSYKLRRFQSRSFSLSCSRSLSRSLCLIRLLVAVHFVFGFAVLYIDYCHCWPFLLVQQHCSVHLHLHCHYDDVCDCVDLLNGNAVDCCEIGYRIFDCCVWIAAIGEDDAHLVLYHLPRTYLDWVDAPSVHSQHHQIRNHYDIYAGQCQNQSSIDCCFHWMKPLS